MNAKPYIVEQGDTLASVAAKFEITKEELVEANGFKKGTKLKEGDTIAIPYTPMPEFRTGQKVVVKEHAQTVYGGYLAPWAYNGKYTVISVEDDGVHIGVSGNLLGVFAAEDLIAAK